MGLRTIGWLVFFVSLGVRASDARAEVVYRVAEHPGAGQFDLNSDRITDFVFQHDGACFMSYPVHCVDFFNIRGPYLAQHRNGLIVDGQSAAELTPQTVIGDSLAGLNWIHGFDPTLIPAVGAALTEGSLPQSPETTMLGVRFEAAEGFHYGWMRIATQPWDPGPIGVSPTNDEVIIVDRIIHGPGEVLDWAYESTPGAAIVAGAVPEAGTVMLGVVGAVMVFIVWRRRTLQRFAQVFGLLTAIVFMSAAASAEVIYQTNTDPDNKLIDLDSNGTPDFRFWVDFNPTDCMACPITAYTFVDGFSRSGLLVNEAHASRVASGITIGPSPPPDGSWTNGFVSNSLSIYEDHAGWHGTWDHSGEGMIGVSFTSDLGVHYGWIQLKLGNDVLLHEWEPGSIDYLRLGPIIRSWAYESTPGAAIVAGAVPEAGTVVLVMVGAVMALLVVWRRRREW